MAISGLEGCHVTDHGRGWLCGYFERLYKQGSFRIENLPGTYQWQCQISVDGYDYESTGPSYAQAFENSIQILYDELSNSGNPNEIEEFTGLDEAYLMNEITDYLNSPLIRALSDRFGSKLETLTATDKLDLAHLIFTAIAWMDHEQESRTLTATAEQHGRVYPDSPNTAIASALIDAYNPSAEELLAVTAILSHHLHKRIYAAYSPVPEQEQMLESLNELFR